MTSTPGQRLLRLRAAATRLRRRLLPSSRPAGGDGAIRLHLGCGSEYWPGYVNIDASPEADSDLRLNFTKVARRFRPGSVAEIAMIHSLGYLRLWEARALFHDLHRLLATGGRLVIETPDLGKCAARALASEGDPAAYLEAVRGLYAFDLDQLEARAAYTPYAFGWSSWHLVLELERAGFGRVRVLDPSTHGPRPWRDTRIEAVK